MLGLSVRRNRQRKVNDYLLYLQKDREANGGRYFPEMEQDKMKVYAAYSKLDKKWQYQIESDYNIWTQWVWFYLGKFLLYEGYQLYPYIFNETHKPNKKLAEYQEHSLCAETLAKRIAKKIDRNYFNHVIKETTKNYGYKK